MASTVRQADVNFSEWDNDARTAAGSAFFALRLGLRQIDRPARRPPRPPASRPRTITLCRYATLCRARAGLTWPHDPHAGGGGCIPLRGLDRRAALWEAKALRDANPTCRSVPEPNQDEGCEPPVTSARHASLRTCGGRLPDAAPVPEGASHGLPARAWRSRGLRPRPPTSLKRYRSNGSARLRLAGLVLVRQRPGSAKGVCFITLEDEMRRLPMLVDLAAGA